VVVAAVAYGDLRKGPKFYTQTHTHTHIQVYIYIGGRVRQSVVRLLPLVHLTGTDRSGVVQFVCDGPNTSPVDTRQQYITRPTVQTGILSTPSNPAATTLSRFPFACNLGAVYYIQRRTLPRPRLQVQRWRGSRRTTAASLPDL